MKKLLLALLLLLPLPVSAARIFVRANPDKIILATASQSITDKLTFSCWYKLAAVPSTTNTILVKSKAANDTDLNYYFDFEQRDATRVYVRIGWTSAISTYVTYKAALTPSVNIWHHLVATIDWTTNPDATNVYSDGVSLGTIQAEGGTDTTPTTGATQQIRIGAWTADNRAWNDELGDIAAWNAILTQNEITALSKGVRPNKLGRAMLYYLPMDGVLTTEPDYSGNGCIGTVTGAARTNNPPLIPF